MESGGKINNETGGTVTNTETGKLDVGTGGVMDNKGTLDNEGDTTVSGTVTNTGSVTNEKNLTVESGGKVNNETGGTVTNTNTGNLDVDTGGSLGNKGTLDNEGNTTVSGEITNTGILTNEAGGNIKLENGTINTPESGGGSFNNNGTVAGPGTLSGTQPTGSGSTSVTPPTKPDPPKPPVDPDNPDVPDKPNPPTPPVDPDKPVSPGVIRFQIGIEFSEALDFQIEDMCCASLGIDGVSIDTQDAAVKAIERIKNAVNTVSDYRGYIGATQNRIEYTINNLSVMQENITNAESLIRDTDVASEMMKYTKSNILIQSSQAMLAQANQLPQAVLTLLS